MDLSPTFKLVDGVWHLTRFEDLCKGDTMKSFNDRPSKDLTVPVDFQELRSRTCTSDPYLSNNGPGGAEVWTIEVDLDEQEEKNDNDS
jgi:hypothetical protein